MKSLKVFIHVAFLLTGILFVSTESLALISYSVPSLEKVGTSSGSVTVKSITDDTQVAGAGFQVVIPKGWTLNLLGESNSFLSTFNAFPSELIDTDPVYFGVFNMKGDLDLGKLKKSHQKKGHVVKVISAATFRAMQTEFLDAKTSSHEQKVFLWYVQAKSGKFKILAGAPKADSKNIEALRNILKSLKFN